MRVAGADSSTSRFRGELIDPSIGPNRRVESSSAVQLSFLPQIPTFPSTRFQGSKAKLTDWIWDCIRGLHFESALDPFGGTGAVAHMLKQQEKAVTYNDVLRFNWYIGLALIENDLVTLTPEDIAFVLGEQSNPGKASFVKETFPDIYFTESENVWIDRVASNIRQLDGTYRQALAYFALFQSCIAKRPFNLFHRKNLYLRNSDVERSFGNKTTWDTPFETHFRRFAKEANQAVFSNGKPCKALNQDVFELEDDCDLVYIDTPYLNRKGVGVDYLGFYHFLEGLANYEKWHTMVDYRSKHRRLRGQRSVWTDKTRIASAFDRLFRRFRDRILVVSYRSDGIPTIGELQQMLLKYKPHVRQERREGYKYVLSNNCTDEVLLVGT